MGNLLRKISKKKWSDNAPLPLQQYSADSITGCIKTLHNTLSLWKSDTMDFTAKCVEDLVTALATTTQKPDVIDVIWLNKSDLEQLGLEIKDSDGNTPYSTVNDRHCDIVDMNYQKLGDVGEYLVKRVNNTNNLKRFSKNKVLTLVENSVKNGYVDIRSLSEKWRTAVDPETFPPKSKT